MGACRRPDTRKIELARRRAGGIRIREGARILKPPCDPHIRDNRPGPGIKASSPATRRRLADLPAAADHQRAMPLRAPGRIWRFLLADLLRLGFMASSLLVVVISFAFSVRFLAEGVIDLPGAVRFSVFGLVPMLQYTLPFACGFAATLTYHRFASDREATAAAAGGISHRAVLVPALAIGVLLGGTVGFLSHQVIPRFLRMMEEVVTRDLPGMLERSIARGESVRLGNIELYARQILRAGRDPSIGAFERLRLNEVLAATLDARGRVQGYIIADEVSVWLFQEEVEGQPFTAAQFQFKGATGEGIGDSIRGGAFATHRMRIPSTFVDDPKYLTWSELAALRERPENINRIDAFRRGLVHRMEESVQAEAAADAIAESGRCVFLRAGGERVIVQATEMAAEDGGWALRAGDAGVRIERHLPSGGVRRLRAATARLEPDRPAAEEAPGVRSTLRLRLAGAGEDDGDDSARGGDESITISGLMPMSGAPDDLAGLTVADLLARAAELIGRRGAEAGAGVREAAALLARKSDSLQREVTSKQHERAGYAVACFLTLVAGAVTALRRGDSMPLPVYLWSFFPALGSVITISAGQGLTHQAGLPGLLLLWGGVAGLSAVVAREYALLVRH